MKNPTSQKPGIGKTKNFWFPTPLGRPLFVVGKQKTLVRRWVEVLIQSAVVQFCHTGVTEFTLVAEHLHVARGSRGW